MAQTGYTPISIYYSATATNTPTAGNLVAGELAINTADGKLFYKDSSGVVQTIASKNGVAGGSNTQVQYNSSGSLAGSANMVFDGSTLTTLNLAYTGTLTGGTGVVNLGSGQFYKNASGNVGIGTTTPNTKLVPLSSTGVPLSSYTNTSAVFQGAYGVGNGGAIGFDCASNSTNYPTGIGYVVTNNAGYTLGDMVFGTRSVTTDTAPTERMRISSTGSVGIGVSSPANTLQISSGSAAEFDMLVSGTRTGTLYTDNSQMFVVAVTAIPMIFRTADTERMRIDSSGNVFVGATGGIGANERFGVYRSDNGTSAVFATTNASQTNDIFQVRANRNTTNSSYRPIIYYNDAAGAYRFIVADSGNVTNTNGSYGTISDVRLKENIVDATSKLDKVNQLKVRNFNLIGDDLKQIGFVAQEFEEVFPSMVEESQDKTPDGEMLETTTKTIKTTVLIPILVKAIQELNAKVDAQAVEIASLKAK